MKYRSSATAQLREYRRDDEQRSQAELESAAAEPRANRHLDRRQQQARRNCPEGDRSLTLRRNRATRICPQEERTRRRSAQGERCGFGVRGNQQWPCVGDSDFGGSIMRSLSSTAARRSKRIPRVRERTASGQRKGFRCPLLRGRLRSPYRHIVAGSFCRLMPGFHIPNPGRTGQRRHGRFLEFRWRQQDLLITII